MLTVKEFEKDGIKHYDLSSVELEPATAKPDEAAGPAKGGSLRTVPGSGAAPSNRNIGPPISTRDIATLLKDVKTPVGEPQLDVHPQAQARNADKVVTDFFGKTGKNGKNGDSVFIGKKGTVYLFLPNHCVPPAIRARWVVYGGAVSILANGTQGHGLYRETLAR